MVITVQVPNVNLELACTIRDIAAKWGIEDYTIISVEWHTAKTGFFVIRHSNATRHAFTLTEAYLDWDQRKQRTLEVM
jgi:hypothetical protein